MRARLVQTTTQLVHGYDGGLSVAVKDVENMSFAELAVQGHVVHVERELFQCRSVAVHRVREYLSSVFPGVLQQEVE